MSGLPRDEKAPCSPPPRKIGEPDDHGTAPITDNLQVAFAPRGHPVNERLFGDLAASDVNKDLAACLRKPAIDECTYDIRIGMYRRNALHSATC